MSLSEKQKQHLDKIHNSKEVIKKRSESLKKKWANDEEYRKRMSEAHKGNKCSEETKEKMSRIAKEKGFGKWSKGRIPWIKGRTHSEETLEKIPLFKKGHTPWNKGKEIPQIQGENHWNWKGGLRNRKRNNERNDSRYHAWVKSVKERDNWTCKIDNEDCSGYCIVHHIESWRDNPNKRYDVNNGITLCQAHHPRKRAEEKQLIPNFKELIANEG